MDLAVESKKSWYEKNYKLFIIIPAFMLILSLVYLFSLYSSTGDFIKKDVTLTGGTTLTVYTQEDAKILENKLKTEFTDILVRSLADATGKQVALTIESATEPEKLKEAVQTALGIELTETNSSVEFTGASLSRSFYKELIRAIIIAFFLMAVVVFLIFKKIIPSVAVVQAAFFDVVVTLAITNLLGIKVSTAGIAAFLMLIGYSVDTDILLTTKVLKRRESPLNQRLRASFRTGITMTLTSITAVFIAYLVVISTVLKQVFLILTLGLIIDLFSTWLTNISLIKWYCEKKAIT